MALPEAGADPEDTRATVGWRWALAIPGVLAVVQGLLMYFVFKTDTPTFYMESGNRAMVLLIAFIML